MNRCILLQQWYENILHRISLFDHPFLIIILLFPCLFLLKIFSRIEKLNLPPSPPKLPIIGNLHLIRKSRHLSFTALSEKYGPLTLLHFGHARVLIVQSVELAKVVINDVALSGRPQIRAADELFFGCTDLAFCHHNEYWTKVKKFCLVEILSQRRVQGFQFVREEEISKVLETIKSVCLTRKKNETVDLSEMFFKLSSNVISRCAIGKVYDNDDVNFREMVKRALELLDAVCFQDFIPSMGWIDVLTGFSGNLKRTSKAIHNFIDQLIEERRVSTKDDHDNYDKKDFLDILLQQEKDNTFGINLTRENLKAFLLDMFIGGTDTTATTLEWTMTEIMKNQRVMKKVQDEIRRVVGKKPKIEETDIDPMEYLKCVVKESLRFHAPALVPRHTSTTSVTKLAGYDIPPKTTVLINAWAIQRDPNLWDRPQEFIPERFIDENSIDFKGSRGHLIPFGGGRRGCPGISFATTEVEYVLANLLYWFDWELPDGVKELDMSEAYVLVIRKKVPLCLVPVMHSH
ncbi:hypothetical protein ACFE04_027085 [Oxalis oulophora]